ncbi:MAG: hypothetical protein ACI4PC_07200 [Oscillospiraceae bacterium]
MLGKLMKYEFKATARIFLPVYAVLVALCLIGRIVGNFEELSDSIVFVIGVMLIAAAFCAVAVVTFVLIIKRFWDNLLGREGYLMHTLPAREWQHILAKLFTSAIWCLCSVLVALLAIFLLAGDAIRITFNGEFLGTLREMFAAFREHALLGVMIRFVVETVVLLLIGCFAAILMMYLAMSIGQLVNRGRVWAAIGSYVGISILLSLLQDGLGELLDKGIHVVVTTEAGVSWMEVYREAIGAVNSTMLWAIVLCLVEAVAFFFATNYLLSRRLNLK